MIKLVVIDFDDTLCLTEAATFELENHVAKEIGLAPMSREMHIANWGTPFREALLDRFPGIDLEAFLEVYNKFIPEYVQKGLLDVVSEINLNTLLKLRKEGLGVAILTSRELFEVEHLLHKDHILNNFIDGFYHKDNTMFHKPDPRVFDSVFADFKISPSEAVYIGDSVSDGESSKGAGMHFIALLESGLRTKDDFASVSVDYFATTFSDILTYVLPQ